MLSGLAWRTIRLGFKSLMLHKLRSALTTLGILFGVASVIAMLSIGEGASFEAQERIKALGSTNILLDSAKPPEKADRQTQASSFRALEYGLTYEDAVAIAETLPAVEVVVPVRKVPKRVRYADRVASNVVVHGTVPRFADVSGIQLARGRFLTDLDLLLRRNVAVLGADLARRLFPLTDPIGKAIRIGAESFRVIGELTPGGRGPGAEEARRGVFVPLSAARAFFGELTVKVSSGSREFERVQLHRIQVRVASTQDVLGTAQALRALLARRHREKDYAVTVPLELLRQAEETKRIFNIVLGSIAGISLLVGGIGIMNVMLATVTERTREIGIRRALGARRRHIVAQFLVETVVLSCLGGLLGIALGIGIPVLVQYLSQLRTIVRPLFPLLAFGISAAVGVLFGLYPAWRAAQMDPVEALRHE